MRNKKFTITALAIMAFIFIQSALPADVSSAESGRVVDWIMRTFQGILPSDRETVVFAVRKGAHFAEYMILGCVLLLAVDEWLIVDEATAGKNNPAAWLIGTLYAVTDEVHQYFVPGRSCELRDMAIDSCGVLAGVLIVTLIRRRKARRRSG